MGRFDEFAVKSFTVARGVSTHLTWEKEFNQTFYKSVVLVSETIIWKAVKGQFCITLVESILQVRVRCVRLQTFNLLTTTIMFDNSGKLL